MTIKPETREYLPLIAEAWEQMKSKGDPVFDACHADHQATLIYKAESVIKSGTAGDDLFSQKFRALFNAKPAKSDADTKKLKK